jgi:tetrahydromethanopterin S-methyltransferase subunit G
MAEPDKVASKGASDAPLATNLVLAQLVAMRDRFDAIDTRLSRIEARLGAIEHRLGAIEQRLQFGDEQFARIERRLELRETP